MPSSSLHASKIFHISSSALMSSVSSHSTCSRLLAKKTWFGTNDSIVSWDTTGLDSSNWTAFCRWFTRLCICVAEVSWSGKKVLIVLWETSVLGSLTWTRCCGGFLMLFVYVDDGFWFGTKVLITSCDITDLGSWTSANF